MTHFVMGPNYISVNESVQFSKDKSRVYIVYKRDTGCHVMGADWYTFDTRHPVRDEGRGNGKNGIMHCVGESKTQTESRFEIANLRFEHTRSMRPRSIKSSDNDAREKRVMLAAEQHRSVRIPRNKTRSRCTYHRASTWTRL